MNPICPLDLVRLRHTPGWEGVVLVLADGQALLDSCGVLSWVPLEFLELVPEQMEEMAA